MIRRIPVWIVVALSFAGLASTQEMSGGLEGRVAFDTESFLGDVEIEISGPTLLGTRATRTDPNGRFRVSALPVGTYDVRFRHQVIAPTVLNEVPVSLGRTTSLGTVLLKLVAPGEHEIEVTAETPSIDYSSTTIGGNLNAAIFDQLPVNREYRSMIALLPQANPSGVGDETNISGSTGLENVHYIDGVNVSDVVVGGGSTNIPYNFVTEVQVKEGGYEAEFGRSSGGIINVVTRSGSNEIHGEVFGFYTSGSFSGTPRIPNARAENYSAYDLGFSLGGPLNHDRLWVFGAYDRGSSRTEIEIGEFGVFPDETTINSFAAKLTWAPAQNISTLLSAFGDPTDGSIVLDPPIGGALNVDPLLQTRDGGGINITASATSVISDNVLLDASIAYYQRKDHVQGATEIGRTEPSFIDLRTGTISGGVGDFIRNDAERTSAKLAATWYSGRHELKGGIEYEYVSNSVVEQTTPPGKIEQVADSAYRSLFADRDVNVQNRVGTIFVQDSWLVSDRLRLNLGLRWDGQHLIAADGELAQPITDQFQPRIGLLYELGRPGTQKVFASFGRFYQQMVLFSPLLAYAPWDNWADIWDQDPREPGSIPVDRNVFASADGPYLPEVEGLRGEHFDEIIVGYDLALPQRITVRARGIERSVREAVGVGFHPIGPPDFGNPGSGNLSWLPPYTRGYRALELTLQRSSAGKLGFLLSYVYSRNLGNYGGLYAADQRRAAPQNYFSLQLEDQILNSTGLLPNDRTHAFKLVGTWAATPDLSVGTFFSIMNGTPLNELGASWLIYRPVFLVERGSAGRTPTLWDLNFRISYNLRRLFGTASAPEIRVIADIQHVGSPRKAVDYDQQRFLAVDPDSGEQIAPNPGYGQAIGFQDPMRLRLGVQIGF